MLLEAAAGQSQSRPSVTTDLPLLGGDPAVLDWGPCLLDLLARQNAGATMADLAFGFHLALAQGITTVAASVGVERVALTGGCLQNALLTELCIDALRAAGMRPYWHQRIPPNDGGLALGQLAAAFDGATGE